MSTTAAAVNTERRRREQDAKNRSRAKSKERTETRPAAAEPRGGLKRGNTMAVLKKSVSREPRVSPEAAQFQVPSGATVSAEDAKIHRTVSQVKQPETRLDKCLAWWVIDPRTSKVLGYWDVCTVLALLFVALVTPFGARTRARRTPTPRRTPPPRGSCAIMSPHFSSCRARMD